jgi:hypothetical protein
MYEKQPMFGPRAQSWAGHAVSAPAVGMLVFSAYMKLAPPANFAEGMGHLGWPVEQATGLAILELSCVALYLIPRTAVLGAILIAGYMGGAIAAHVRVGDPVVFQPLVGVLAWLGLWLREPRLRALLPLRRR